MFRNDLKRSTYFSVYREDCCQQVVSLWWWLQGSNIIVDSKAGRTGSVSFWNANAEKVLALLLKVLQAAIYSTTSIGDV